MKDNTNRVLASIFMWLSIIRDQVWRETIMQYCSVTPRGKNKQYGRKLQTEPTQRSKQTNSQNRYIPVMEGVNANCKLQTCKLRKSSSGTKDYNEQIFGVKTRRCASTFTHLGRFVKLVFSSVCVNILKQELLWVRNSFQTFDQLMRLSLNQI